MDEEEEREGNGELPGMPEDQDNSNLGIMPLTHNALTSHYPSQTVENQDQDINIQNAKQLDLVDPDFNNIAIMDLEGANDSDAQAQKEDRIDNVDVDWRVNVLVRVVAGRALELLLELSCCQGSCQSSCQSCGQSCYQSSCQSSAAVKAVVRAVDRAQPSVRAAVRMLIEANFYSQVSGADG
jgi:hypothetical protein